MALTNNNTFLNAPNATYSVSSILTYSCSSGFDIRGGENRETVCNSSFIWSLDADPPSCVRGKKISLAYLFVEFSYMSYFYKNFLF